MQGVFSDPRPAQIKDANNGILQAVKKLGEHLPAHGFEYVDNPRAAHVYVRHAGGDNNLPVHVEHCHGLIPTAMHNMSDVADAINARVIDNLIKAKAVTVPSEWVADIIRRDLRFEPYVVPWGIDIDEWAPGECKNYVLWAKGRPDLVCSPVPMNELALRAPEVQFLSTFGDSENNVQIIGQQSFVNMKQMIAGAMVYLATTRETFGIQTLEAMACGVPVLGFDWAGTGDIVEHGVTGYLAKPGDFNDLTAGLWYCIENRETLGRNGLGAARRYTWERSAGLMAEVYRASLVEHDGPEVSIIIPCYNYAGFVREAIETAVPDPVSKQRGQRGTLYRIPALCYSQPQLAILSRLEPRPVPPCPNECLPPNHAAGRYLVIPLRQPIIVDFSRRPGHLLPYRAPVVDT